MSNAATETEEATGDRKWVGYYVVPCNMRSTLIADVFKLLSIPDMATGKALRAVLGLARVTSAETRERQVRTYRFMRAYAREQGSWKLIASQQQQVPDRAFGAALQGSTLAPR